MVSPHCTVQPGKVLIFFDVTCMRIFLKSRLFFKKQQNLYFSHFKIDKNYRKVGSSRPVYLLFNFGTFWPKATIYKDQISPS